MLAARTQLRTETVALSAVRGLVLAEPLIADRDFPPFPRATRDGYAVRAADVEQVPGRLDVIGEIKAGDSADKYTVNRGQAVSIMTGAPLPAGADAVVMVEYTAASAMGLGQNSVEIQRSVASGENFVPQGCGGASWTTSRGSRASSGSCAHCDSRVRWQSRKFRSFASRV